MCAYSKTTSYKKTLMHISLLLIALQFFSCALEKEPAYELVWSDDFTKNGAPDSTFWTYDIGTGSNGWGNNEIQSYTRDPKNVRVENDLLIIDAIKENDQWTSARLKTQGRNEWQYGKIEFRAKLPQGVGTWPALWMLGNDIPTVGWPACGEIDIMEHVGRNPGVVQSALHNSSSYGDTFNKGETSVPDFHSAFHIYQLIWDQHKMDFLVDDKLFYTYAPQEKTDATWPYNKPYFIIMNIAIGGGFGGQVDPQLKHARMEIDYVKVYQRSGKISQTN